MEDKMTVLSTAPAFRLVRPVQQQTSVIFSSPHSGRDYPQAFLEASPLAPLALRSSEDAYIDRLFARAPLFGAPGVTTAVLRPAAPPMPAPRPVALAQPAPAAPTPAAPVARAPEPAATPRAAEPAATVQKKDPIGALIKGDGLADPVVPPARVAAVQKALVKAGFVLRADGVMGASTKQALERFERDNKLPVTGDLAPRTLRELADQSGVAIP
jgi:hypothetical protein